jgi:membrane protease YdiL (CAAX protease family)
MPIIAQLFIFVITGLLLYVGIYYLTPFLIKKGVPLIYSFWFCLWLPVMMLFPVSVLTYHLEGNAWTLRSVSERFRFHTLGTSDWLWVVGAIVLTITFDQLLEPLGKFFAKIPFLAPPGYLPAPFNPLKKMDLPPFEFFGVPLYKNWVLIIVFIPLHLFAMFSEEIMWRGLILPAQVEMFGDWAWILNGLLWAWIVHACLKWHFINMLPSMLIAPWIAQFTGSTWASFAVHAIGNSLLWVLLIAGILKNRTLESKIVS